MSERSIFLNALDREDHAARAAYLDEACAGRPELRQRIERLLQSQAVKDTFLEVPAPEQLAAAEESLAFLEPPREPGALGRLDHYEVLEIVGRGGTGMVLKAHDSKLLRVVAIKKLAPHLATSVTARRRFVREAQAAAAVRDDHLVAIYAVSDDGAVPYLVMEYINGITLEQLVKQVGKLELAEILRIGMQLAKGLAAAHAQGVIHRDIKPANILLENGVQRVKITDFGLARVADEAGPADAKVLAGTPLYMSPEQARGESTDHRTDLFSFGSVLYTLCAGRPPFQGDTTAAVLRSVCNDTAPPVGESHPHVPAWLSALITKLHAKEAKDRIATAQELADLLSGQLALLQQPPLTPPPSAAPPVSAPVGQPAPRRQKVLFSRRVAVAFFLVGLLAALVVVIVLLKPWQPRETDPSEGGATPEDTGPVEPLEFRRENIPPLLLAVAGGGPPARAPQEMAAVVGDARFVLPRPGSLSWMGAKPRRQGPGGALR
jgi:serine/threonine protein kinase